MEMGLRCVRGGLALLILSYFSLISHKNEIGLSETKIFHFHRLFNNWDGGRVRANPLWIRHCCTKAS